MELFADWSTVTRLVFVCHGNICRSPMGECLMSHLLKRAGVDGVSVVSFATSTEEIGNGIYPPALSTLRRHGIPVIPHHAVQLQARDWDTHSLYLGMDSMNIRNMVRILGKESASRCYRVLDFTERPRDISDPWFTGDFEETWNDLLEGCQALLAYLQA